MSVDVTFWHKCVLTFLISGTNPSILIEENAIAENRTKRKLEQEEGKSCFKKPKPEELGKLETMF